MALVAIHGLGCHPSQGWPRVARALGEPIKTPLLTGAEATDAPATEWPLRVQATRLAELLDPGDVLIGHSMGGAIAIRMGAMVEPRALVLVEPHVVPSAGFVVKPALRAGADPDAAAREAFLAAMATISTGEGTYADSISHWHWPAFHALCHELAHGDGGNTSWLDDLAGLACPVHLVWGARSPPQDVHLDALRSVGIGPTWIKDSGHFIPSEQPTRLAAFLAGLA